MSNQSLLYTELFYSGKNFLQKHLPEKSNVEVFA